MKTARDLELDRIMIDDYGGYRPENQYLTKIVMIKGGSCPPKSQFGCIRGGMLVWWYKSKKDLKDKSYYFHHRYVGALCHVPLRETCPTMEWHWIPAFAGMTSSVSLRVWFIPALLIPAIPPPHPGESFPH